MNASEYVDAMNALRETGGPVSRGRGRPSTGTRIEVRLPVDVLARIDKWAEAEGTTRALVVRRALVEMFGESPSN